MDKILPSTLRLLNVSYTKKEMLKNQMKCSLIFYYVNIVMWFNPTKKPVKIVAGWNARVKLGERKKAPATERENRQVEMRKKIKGESEQKDTFCSLYDLSLKKRDTQREREKALWWNPFVWAWLPTICWLSIWCILCVILTAHTLPYNTVHKHTFLYILKACILHFLQHFHTPIPSHAYMC